MRNASERPIICCVTPGARQPTEDRRQVLNFVTEGIRAGADWVQIREKDLSAKDGLTLTREAVESARSTKRHVQILVNDRLDVALAAGADGVHLAGQSIPTASIAHWRRNGNAPRNFLVGVSCHSLEEVQLAEASAANYVFFGPVFETPSKKAFGAPQGVERLAAVCRAVNIPVIAIGGVDETNAAECLRADASGIAAIRLFEGQHNSAALAELISRLHAFA